MPKVGKPTSKRVPVRLRHKIEKKSAAKQKKLRRLAKKDPTWRTKLKKDPGIPNLFPYKEKLLEDIEQKRQEKEAEALRKRHEAKQRSKAVNEDVMVDEDDDEEDFIGSDDEILSEDDAMDEDGEVNPSVNPMAALAASARAQAREWEGAKDTDKMEDGEDDDEWGGIDENEDDSTQRRNTKDSSRKAFDKVFKQVVDAADVILYVLDARDPEGTRSKEVERSILSADGGKKRLILILNKIDLIPPPILKGWLAHLRRSFPTLPIRASNPAANAKTFDHKHLTVKGTSEALFKSLKSYAQSKQLKRAISVGVIGYPNVGKSSVINALSSRLGGRGSACPVGAEAGVTTNMREVKLDNKLKLLDCPGIVFPNAGENTKVDKAEAKARLILLNAIPPREIDDPMPAVKLLLKRMSTSPAMQQKLLDVYGLPPLMSSGDDIMTDFLVQVARKRGRLGKGGVPSMNGAAQTVITDWRDGRIQGWIDPPTGKIAANGQLIDLAPEGDHKVIVKEWAAEFNLDALLPEEKMEDSNAMEE